jgi:hypothetical protein
LAQLAANGGSPPFFTEMCKVQQFGHSTRTSKTASGPKPPLADVPDAAPQLPQTGHACIAQHFRGAKERRTKRLLV